MVVTQGRAQLCCCCCATPLFCLIWLTPALLLFVHHLAARFGVLTETQRTWVETQLMLNRAQPIRVSKPPKASWRRFVYFIVIHDAFDGFILFVIAISVISQVCVCVCQCVCVVVAT